MVVSLAAWLENVGVARKVQQMADRWVDERVACLELMRVV